jgi:hypothetical protein
VLARYPLSAVGIGRGERPQPVEGRLEVAPHAERIEGLVEPVERLPFGRRQDPGGAEALVRRLRAIVDPPRAGALARLHHQLLHGLKEI